MDFIHGFKKRFIHGFKFFICLDLSESQITTMDKIQKLEKELEQNRNSLSTDRLDMSYGEIMNMYEKDEIIIDPEFQRLFRWDRYKKTRFIESILIGIPIPPIFVAEDEIGRWELVDGLQRMSTVFSFFGILKKLPEKNNWILDEGNLVKDFRDLAMKDLPLKYQLNIKRASCRVEIIKWNSAFDMRYELFNRLNTGGAWATDQEIRNCIFRGVSQEFNKFLKRSAENNDFVNLIKPTKKQTEELYMQELVLRFCSLYDFDTANLSDNISQHMTKYMRDAVKDTSNIPTLEQVFTDVISILKPMGRDVFRGENGVFSTSLYDCIMLGVGKNIEFYKKERSDLILDRIKRLKSSVSFKKASGSASASKSRIVKRIEVAEKIFKP